jgi:hypothetical protein
VDDGLRVFAVEIKQIGYNVDKSLSMSAASFRTDFPLTVSADRQRRDRERLQFTAVTIPYVYDLPILFPYNDLFASNNTDGWLYSTLGPETIRPWDGGYMQYSPDGTSYQQLYQSATENVHAIVIQPLDPIDFNVVGQIDFDSRLQVRLNNSNNTLSSITLAELLNADKNMIIIGEPQKEEIVFFQNAVYDAPNNIWTLDTFIRGYRGTDDRIQERVAGERALFFDNSSFVFSQRVPPEVLGSNANGLTSTLVYHRALGFNGQEIDPARYVSSLYNARSMRPFAPSSVEATDVSGDLVISYQQRSRSQDVFPDDGSETFVDWETITQFRCFFYSDNTFNPSTGLLGQLDDDATDTLGS